MLRPPTVAAAQAADLPAAKQLLSRCGLPVDDVDRHFDGFVVAKDGSTFLGVAGIERAGPYALLRSLAVVEDRRREGIAAKLCEALLARARKQGVRDVYLLTTTASHYFAKLGFVPVGRATAPAEIAGTAEFAKLCPATAAVMAKRL